MNAMWSLTTRNIRVYVRDRASVFFSFLSVIIIITLYALFLGKIQVDYVKQSVGDHPGIAALVNSWIMAGLLAVNAVTIGLGVLGTMVYDVENKRFQDFIVAPVSRTAVVVSYLVASWIISFLFSLIALVASELFILSGGGQLLGLVPMLKAVGMIALAVVTSSTIMFLIATYLKSGSAFGTLSTLVGTLIGFLAGVYVPVGVLPDAVQKVVDLVPFSHSAAMLRQVFCAGPIATVFAGAPPQAAANYERLNGIRLFWGSHEITMGMMLGVLAGVIVVFLILSAIRVRRYSKKG